MTQREFEWNEEVPLSLNEQARASSRVDFQPHILESRFYLFAKRTMDIALSSIGLVVLFPFLLIISVLIYLDDPMGGPIFVQDRVGKNGKVFRFLNARSMLDAGYVARRIGRILRYLLCETHESIMDTRFQTSNC
jgi:lipopolysaccharide/colanic/teichoic acid biosynthesis glycosyltransferase